jgi:hypothetical protein
MRQAAIVFVAVILGVLAVYAIIAILPFLLAVAGVIFIKWLIYSWLSGRL